MGIALQTSLPPSEISLPADLRAWIDKHTLARLVLAAVQLASLPTSNEGPAGSASFRPHIVLSLLTYCYASGIHSSTDIELSSTQDTMVRHLCADNYPEARMLRSFRRYHRQSIKQCLAEVLQRAWRIRIGLEQTDPYETVVSTGFSPEPTTDRWDVRQFAAEAEERIGCAVRLDCGAFDY